MAANFYSARQIAGAMVRAGATKEDLLHFSRWFEEAAMESEMYMDDAKKRLTQQGVLQLISDIRLLTDLSEALESKT